MVTIKVRQNGSLLVEGEDVRLIDWNGNEYVLAKKPFCDSSHKLCNFQADEAAPGPNAAPPVPPAAPETVQS